MERPKNRSLPLEIEIKISRLSYSSIFMTNRNRGGRGGDCGDKFDEKIYDCVHVSSLLCYIQMTPYNWSCTCPIICNRRWRIVVPEFHEPGRSTSVQWQSQQALPVQLAAAARPATRYYATWPFLQLIHEPLSSSPESWRAWPTEGLCLRFTVWHKHSRYSYRVRVCECAPQPNKGCFDSPQLRESNPVAKKSRTARLFTLFLRQNVCILCFDAAVTCCHKTQQIVHCL